MFKDILNFMNGTFNIVVWLLGKWNLLNDFVLVFILLDFIFGWYWGLNLKPCIC
jgi:hypothetical protein